MGLLKKNILKLGLLAVRGPKSWEFLLRLLGNSISNPTLIRWEDESQGIFRLVRRKEVAKIWASRSSRKTPPKQGWYSSFARILRY